MLSIKTWFTECNTINSSVTVCFVHVTVVSLQEQLSLRVQPAYYPHKQVDNSHQHLQRRGSRNTGACDDMNMYTA